MSVYCPCGRRCRGDYCWYCLVKSQRRQERQRGPGRPKGSRNEANDIPAAEIERRFQQAKTQQLFERRKHQRVSLDPGRA